MRRLPARSRSTATFALVGIVALVLSATPATAGDKKLDLELCAPDENRFTLDINNRYFPLQIGQRWVLVGVEDTEPVGLRITVLRATEQFRFRSGTVTTRVVEERHWEDTNQDGRLDRDESLLEVSRNYFAQTQDGTVCYFGEAVDIFNPDGTVSHEGSWRADGGRKNAPGIFMPADPRPGMTFQQEVAPGVAEDRGTIVESGTVEVPAGTFHDTIGVEEFNPLDGDTSFKVYARNVGLIVDEPLELVMYSSRGGEDDD